MSSFDCTHVRCIVVAVLVIAVIGCSKDSAKSSSKASLKTESKQLPVSLLDLDDKPYDLLPAKLGPITVVLFTRSDCPISNRFAPEICRLYEAYHSRGVEFYLIYVDPNEKPDAIRHHLQEYKYPCPGLRDPKHTLVAYCQTTTTPEAVVFNKDRTIAYQGRVNDLYVELGKPRAEPTTHDLEDAIESTVEGRPVATPRTKAIGCLIADLEE